MRAASGFLAQQARKSGVSWGILLLIWLFVCLFLFTYSHVFVYICLLVHFNKYQQARKRGSAGGFSIKLGYLFVFPFFSSHDTWPDRFVDVCLMVGFLSVFVKGNA